MKIVICPDSFKGSLTAALAAGAIARGVHSVLPDADLVLIPVADGGEGTLDVLLAQREGRRIVQTVCNPLSSQVDAAYGIFDNGSLAVIEMAQAAGLHLVPTMSKNPLYTTSFGVGELILDAVQKGVSKLIVGVGGSATNDGGAGAMQALGVDFYDTYGQIIRRKLSGSDLLEIDRIDLEHIKFPIDQVKVVVASDVTNPFVGKEGASIVFGPQKGATNEDAILLDTALDHFSKIVLRDIGVDIASMAGAGAAGGLAGALVAFLGASMVSGIDMVLDHCSFDSKISGADLIITGEGNVDLQTLRGKAIVGVLRHSFTCSIPVIAFAGAVDADAENELIRCGIRAVIPINDRPMSLSDSCANASVLLENSAARAMRLIMLQSS